MTDPSPTAPAAENADLHAYLDGELAGDALPALEARLACDIKARILLKSLTIQRQALQSKYPLPDDCPKTHAMVEAVLRPPGVES